LRGRRVRQDGDSGNARDVAASRGIAYQTTSPPVSSAFRRDSSPDSASGRRESRLMALSPEPGVCHAMRLPNPKAGRLVLAILAVSAAAACGKSTPVEDAALRRDLALVGGSGSGLELAPRSGSQAVVSAEELIPAGNRSKASTAPASVTRHPVARAASRRIAAPVSVPAPHDSVAVAAPPTQRPLPASSISAPPPGGYKTMGELIRKAPFPINP
jgi:hypothetical protein